MKRDDGSGPKDIKAEIVEKRLGRIKEQGHSLGHPIPAVRQAPLVPFLDGPGVICEVKRKSPSKGEISMSLDPVVQAGRYYEAGVRSVSVLTEEDYFSGSLEDLMAVKAAYPGLAVLRKDFLVDEEDLDVSYRAGADAVLLIASMLTGDELASMYRKALSLGMAVLFEIHDEDDIAKAAYVKPEIIGINCRDLKTFTTDLVYPLKVRARLLKEGISYGRLVFESGIFRKEDAAFAYNSGFSAVLVGEGVVRNPGLIPELVEASAEFFTKDGKAGFWGCLYQRRYGAAGSLADPGKMPLVKVCGLTRLEDAKLAAESGADILGFIFVESSPRFTNAALVRSVDAMLKASATAELPLKAAVVVTGTGDSGEIPAEVLELLNEGIIDAVQFHGAETPDGCFPVAFPYYKALRIGTAEHAASVSEYRCPRILVDAFSKEGYGGTGRRIDPALVGEVKNRTPLWIAGGINPDNVAEIVETWEPELIDLASGIESAPGIKDHEKMKSFFGALGVFKR